MRKLSFRVTQRTQCTALALALASCAAVGLCCCRVLLELPVRLQQLLGDLQWRVFTRLFLAHFLCTLPLLHHSTWMSTLLPLLPSFAGFCSVPSGPVFPGVRPWSYSSQSVATRRSNTLKKRNSLLKRVLLCDIFQNVVMEKEINSLYTKPCEVFFHTAIWRFGLLSSTMFAQGAD